MPLGGWGEGEGKCAGVDVFFPSSPTRSLFLITFSFGIPVGATAESRDSLEM